LHYIKGSDIAITDLAFEAVEKQWVTFTVFLLRQLPTIAGCQLCNTSGQIITLEECGPYSSSLYHSPNAA
jgi:hypothetical protein